MNDNILSNIKTGILPEDCNVLLPWFSSVKQLKEIGNPEIYEGPQFHGVELIWRNRKCLSGLKCSIDIKLQGKKLLRKANLLTFESGVDKNAREQFQRVNGHLQSVFGFPPTEEVESNYLDYPMVRWIYENIVITHYIFERFGEYCVFEISFKGSQV